MAAILKSATDKFARRAKVVTQQVIRTVPYKTAKGKSFPGKVATGALYRSVTMQTEVTNSSVRVTIWVAPHIEYILSGRPPFPNDPSKLIPLKPPKGNVFRRWGQSKGIRSEGGLHAVRWGINKYGIPATPLDKEVVKALEVDFDRLQKEVVDALHDYAVTEILNIFPKERRG